ncbi:MAG: transketolase [Lentimicrobiaceae bacterium]|nr:transketolase [Lentimicrobiaceae bacterium]
MTSIAELQKIASQVRRDILRMIHHAGSGHPGGSLGCADLLVSLYFSQLKHQAETFTMDGQGEDIFFLSNGHLSAAWYSTLARSGYFPIEELATFRMINTRLQGHPSPKDLSNGVRIASGSLGQGLSVAIGAALAKKLNNDPNLIFTLMGDGEIQEGQVWEAAMFASAKKVDNLIGIIDNNGRQIDGNVDDVLPLGNICAKWEAFGWTVMQMDGNNIPDILSTLTQARKLSGKGKPIMIVMKTEMGFGVDFMMGTHHWHGVAPNDEQLQRALMQLEETLGDFNIAS